MIRLVFRPLAALLVISFLGLVAVSASAQATPLQVVEGSDGTLYLAQGGDVWTIVPNPIIDSDLTALTRSGELDGAIPASFLSRTGTAPAIQAAQSDDGTLYLIQGGTAWVLVPAQISDADLATMNLSGEIRGTIPDQFGGAPVAAPVAEATPAVASVAPAPQAAPACGVGHPVGASGTAVSTLVRGVLTGPLNVPPVSRPCVGTFGIAFDASDNVYVASQLNGDLFKFGHDGGDASSSSAIGRPLDIGAYDLTFGLLGEMYGAQPQTNGDWSAGAIVQINPQAGSVVRSVTQGLVLPTWIATDPINGDLFVTNGGTDSLLSPNLWRIHNPSGAGGGPTVSIFAADNGGFTQVAFAPNGTLYALARDGRVLTFDGADASPSATGSVLTRVTPNSVGLALGPIGSAGKPSTLYFSLPSSISRVDVGNGSITELVSGAGNLFELKVGHDHCLYAPDYANIIKVTDADGSCHLTTATGGTP